MRLGIGILVALFVAVCAPRSDAGVIFGNQGLQGGLRWDADERIIAGVGERSLVGGIRYSMQGGSYEAYRDLFTWNVLPSVALFQQTVEEAFNAWTVVDPVSGFGTQLSFVGDLDTAVVGRQGGVNPEGAEIDLFGQVEASRWTQGDSGTQGETSLAGDSTFGDVTLTSGTTSYADSQAIIGADITINSNPTAVYSIDLFRLLLTHEIGHAIGLADIEGDINPNRFIDDNLDLTDSATALATLMNSWAALVDPLNPANSALQWGLTVPYADPGTLTPGVNILMQSHGLGGQFGNLTPLTNDDYGTRQFLYPEVDPVPEPGTMALVALGVGAAWIVSRRRRRG